MTDPTPHAVSEGLKALSVELRQLQADLDVLEIAAVNRREDYTLAYSKAFLTADGSVEARKHKATILTTVQRLEAEIAEALVRGKKRQVDTCRIRIDIGRTQSALTRAEMELAK